MLICFHISDPEEICNSFIYHPCSWVVQKYGQLEVQMGQFIWKNNYILPGFLDNEPNLQVMNFKPPLCLSTLIGLFLNNLLMIYQVYEKAAIKYN